MELSMKDEIISLLKEKLSGMKLKETPSHGLGGRLHAVKSSKVTKAMPGIYYKVLEP